MTEPLNHDRTSQADPGHLVIARLGELLTADAAWMVPEPDGFTWWGSRIRQRVWTEPAEEVNGERESRVRTLTPVFRDVEDDDAAYAWVNVRNDGPGMGAWVFDPDARTISYRCGAVIGGMALPWVTRWFLTATLVGAGLPLSATADEPPAWPVDDEPHPALGRRSDPHPAVADLRGLQGAGESGTSGPPIPQASLRRLADELSRQGVRSTYDRPKDFLVTPIPFGADETSAWGISSMQHNLLGWGLYMRQSTPRRFGVRRARWIANALNLAEHTNRAGDPAAPAFGAWLSDEDGDLFHVFFLTAPAIGALDQAGEMDLTRMLLFWATRRGAVLAARLPWLESAAAARYPDDLPPELPEGGSGDDADATPTIPYAVRGFGPGARDRRPRPEGPRTDPPRTFVVDPSDPSAYAEIDAAVAVAEDGDTIRVRPGTYRTPVVVDRAVAIVGDGPVEAIVLETVGGESIGFGRSGGSVRGLTIRPALAGNDGELCSALSVMDVAVTAEQCVFSTHLGATAWIAGPSARVVLRDCRFTEGSQNAVYMQDGARVEMVRCDVRGHRWPISVVGRGSSLRIAESTIADNFASGVEIGEAAHLEIRDTTIEGNASHGITLTKAAPASSVTGCTIVGNGGAGIGVQSGTGGVIRGNRIERNTVGILASAGASPLVSENELIDQVHIGMGLWNDGTAPRVIGNTIRNGRSAAIVIKGGAEGTYEGNRITAGDGGAIWVEGGGTRPTVSGNVITGGHGFGITIMGGAGGTFDGNDLRGNARGSWQIEDASELLTRTDNREDAGRIQGVAPTQTPWSPPESGSGPSRAN
jgi:hypothetical protein